MNRGPYILTASGVRFYPLDPRPEEILLADIAAHLSKLCRFTGATREPYSVAHHSCLVADNVSPEHALCGLLHDAPEAYLNDMASPLKRHEFGAIYREAEAWLWRMIADVFWLPYKEPPEVIAADRRVCMTEKRDLLPPAPLDWGWYDVEPLPETIIPWTPREAELRFLLRYRRLAGGIAVAA